MNLFAASQLEWRREWHPEDAVEAGDELIVVAGSPNMLGDTKPGIYAVGPASDVLAVDVGNLARLKDFVEKVVAVGNYGAHPAVLLKHYPKKFQGAPFIEFALLNAWEGAFGRAVAAKLAKDFEDNFGQVVMAGKEGPQWFRDEYAKWFRAFSLAATNGAAVMT